MLLDLFRLFPRLRIEEEQESIALLDLLNNEIVIARLFDRIQSVDLPFKYFPAKIMKLIVHLWFTIR